MTTASCPIVGYLFPGALDEGFDIDAAALAAELAEMEAAPSSDEYDDAFDFYSSLDDWELCAMYTARIA